MPCFISDMTNSAPAGSASMLIREQPRPGVHLDAERAKDAADGRMVAGDQLFDFAETLRRDVVPHVFGAALEVLETPGNCRILSLMVLSIMFMVLIKF